MVYPSLILFVVKQEHNALRVHKEKTMLEDYFVTASDHSQISLLSFNVEIILNHTLFLAGPPKKLLDTPLHTYEMEVHI